jgi:4-amino-4-deoxy-L-arabinose transferase-like glycosyltransferase
VTGWPKGIFWGLCIALGAMLLYRTHNLPLRDYRETRYAEIAREVLERQDWLVLHLNGSLYVNKPPLVSWLVALSFTAFGRNEGAACLLSVLAVLWTAVLAPWGSFCCCTIARRSERFPG